MGAEPSSPKTTISTVIYRISVVLLSTGDDLLNQYLEGTFKFVTVI